MRTLSILVMALLVACTGYTQQPVTGGYKVGDIAKDFNLKNVDSKQVSMAGFKQAKGYVVVFTCNTCPVSKAYEQRIIDLDKKFTPMGYQVIAINPNDPTASPGDTYALMQTRAKEKGYGFPYLEDPGQVVTKEFGATRTPHFFILQKTDKGNVVEYIGAMDDDQEQSSSNPNVYASNAINSLLAGKKPEVSMTKAIG